MSKSFGWWVDLHNVALGDMKWVHALPFGQYQHPLHGEMVFDTAKLNALASSVKTRVRGIDPDIDYDHKADPAKGSQAAGWVKDAEVRDNGLWLQVDFTDTATGEINDKKYRYFSAEFTDTWTDSQGNTHKDVLLGGGLTNRPYMKNLMPVNLSELSLATPPKDTPEAEVDLKKLRELLGLAADATEEACIAKLTEQSASVTTLTAEKTALADQLAKLNTPPPEFDPQLMKLVEASPAFKAMFDDMQAQKKLLSEQQAAIRLAEVKNELDKLQQGKTFALAPSVREELQNIMLKSGGDAAKQLSEFLAKVMSGDALVDLSERGYTGRRIGDDIDASKRFNEMVSQLVTAEKLDYGSAVERIARENPQLFQDYREQTYTFKA